MLGTAGDSLSIDIELLTPDRLVRYLSRTASRLFLERLSESWVQGAGDPSPENSIPAVEDSVAGLSFSIRGSSDATVTVDVLVVADLADDLPDRDGVVFDVSRASLIKAAHELRDWFS